jgi:hypothetical protein
MIWGCCNEKVVLKKLFVEQLLFKAIGVYKA